jgi:hypothetical protein
MMNGKNPQCKGYEIQELWFANVHYWLHNGHYVDCKHGKMGF